MSGAIELTAQILNRITQLEQQFITVQNQCLELDRVYKNILKQTEDQRQALDHTTFRVSNNLRIIQQNFETISKVLPIHKNESENNGTPEERREEVRTDLGASGSLDRTD